ncbi:MAG: cell division protein FtsA [Anaerolineae bacterium]|nr:cell division protein FtsA [Ardenticatenia bacterium]MBK8541423.1 cell division protein FtsA [Ardenticatenia bacterium]HQZ71314.1 cell division protein FtsA [Anaerolineae bacterium]
MSNLVSIDIGSHKICTLIGEALPGGSVRIHGMGHAPAEGIRRGEVVHVDDAAGAIAASIERAERVAGIRVERAMIGITGSHLESMGNVAQIPLGRRPRPVTHADVARLLELAGSVPLQPGREVLHVLPSRYSIDDGGPLSSPLGMEGHRLEAEVHIVTASASALANVRRCLQLAEVKATGLVFSTLAAAESCLTRDERELGVFLVDMGASATGLACYRGGSLIDSAVIPVGGRHMTNDLAVLLQTPLEQAERIKDTYGHVLPELDDEAVEIEIQPFGESVRRKTTRHHISEVLAARADELGRLVFDHLSREEMLERLPAGAVLTGGATELGGLPRRLHERWQTSVRIGRPQDVLGLGEAARGPAHAAAVGLLQWQARGIVDAATIAPSMEGAGNNTRSGVEKALAWAKAAFLPVEDRRGT